MGSSARQIKRLAITDAPKCYRITIASVKPVLLHTLARVGSRSVVPRSRRGAAKKTPRGVLAGRRVVDGRGFSKFITLCHGSAEDLIGRRTW